MTPMIAPIETADVVATPHTELHRVTAIIAAAFADDPPSRWLFSERRTFDRDIRRFIMAFAGRALSTGGAFHIGDEAAALWLPPGVHSDDEALEAFFRDVTPTHRLDDVLSLFGQMDTFHPQEPHWHLAMIGSHPARQGRGLGSRLLLHTLATCDQQRAPAYLEATSARNVALYQRHGFEAIGAIRVGDCPVITPMLRQPH